MTQTRNTSTALLPTKRIFVYMYDDDAVAAKGDVEEGGERYSYSPRNPEGPELLVNPSLGLRILVYGGKTPEDMLTQIASRMEENSTLTCVVMDNAKGEHYKYSIIQYLTGLGINPKRIVHVPATQEV